MHLKARVKTLENRNMLAQRLRRLARWRSGTDDCLVWIGQGWFNTILNNQYLIIQGVLDAYHRF